LARDAELRGAAHVFTPSAWLCELAIGWGVDASRVSVLPNPSPPLPQLRQREELRAELGMDGPTLAFAGRLTAQKSLEVALDAVAAVDGVSLVIAGDGDERARLETYAGPRVRFVGPLPRQGVLELFRAADASILSSIWENFPHTVVEALAVGTPVLATATGGVAEVVTDGVNGLLVPSRDVDALAGAVRRYFDDDGLRSRLRANAADSVAQYAPERVFATLEETLQRVAR
ncbi:MAG: glycosyltransferase family 4 protein, partial [Actinomycetota bacterium]